TAMRRLLLGAIALVIIAILSVFVGVSNVTPQALFSSSEDGRALQIVLVSRIPRTLAILLSGASMAIAGMLMQILARNRFVEPSTAGTVESASLGILVATVLAPSLPLVGKML